jgi:hypothetical protein
MGLAEKGPFTPQELAAEVGFTPNRARQLLAQLQRDGKVAVLGSRKSLRGKPSQLWGIPGTELTDEDRRARPSPAAKRDRKTTSRSTPAASGAAGADSGSFFGRLWKALETGLEIEDPDGKVYTVRLAPRS